MNTIVQEEHSTTYRSQNPLGSYLDASNKSKQAYDMHKSLFDTDKHVERVEAVANIIQSFFGHPPHYYTYRGRGTRTPFESIKVANVGHILSKFSAKKKNEELYKPLEDLGNIKVVPKNGHLTIRVY